MLLYRTITFTYPLYRGLCLRPAFLFIVILFCFFNTKLKAQQTQEQSPAGTNYLIYTPSTYSAAGNGSPLLVTLMGGGEIGDDFSVFFRNNSNRSPAWLIDRGEWPSDYPFVVVTPQLPRDEAIPNVNDQKWPTSLIDEVIADVIGNFNIDTNSLYFTGVSLGATGCWDYAAAFPEKVAAMVPMSGPADVSTACTVKDIPIWAIHGDNDGLVDPFANSTVDMVDSINNCSGLYLAHFDLIPSRGHDIWNDVYPETMGLSIFEWLLKFEKGQTGNTIPYVGLGPDLRLMLPDEFTYIHGFGFDVDSSISTYLWEVINPASATIEVIDDQNIKLFPQVAGLHQIKLTITDNDGTVNSDTVEIEFFETLPGSLNFMSGLMLQDGDSNVDLYQLEDGNNIINLFTLGTSDINIRALDDGLCNSFRFAVNGYQNIRTENRQSVGLLLSRRRNPPEWNVRTGTYLISATPYSGNKNNLGTEGISVSHKLSVYNQEPKSYSLLPDSDISITTNWIDNSSSENPNGFISNFQTFEITDSAYLNSPILETGVVTSIELKSGGYLTLNDSLAIPLILDSAATLQINHSSGVDFSSVHPYANIIYNTVGTLDFSSAGKLTVTSGNQLSLGSDSITLNSLTLGEGAEIQQSTGLNINIIEDLIIEGTTDFTPSAPFSISFNSDRKHQIIYEGNALTFEEISLLSQDTLVILNQTELLLNASRINLTQNASFEIGHAQIHLTGDNIFSENPSGGKLKVGNRSSLFIDASPTENNYLSLDQTGNILKELQFSINGANQILLSDTLKIYGKIEANNGILSSNGYLQLLATDSTTAYLLNNSGNIDGEVISEKIIPQGRVYRYAGSNVLNFSVEKLQNFIPVTGTFAGASSGPTLGSDPSIFSYNTTTESWIPFPNSSNQEVFELGKGYAIFFRNEQEAAKIKWQGELVQNTFDYTLIGNTDIQNEFSGWNLLVNPYASPIEWGTTGWVSSGISNTISVADNTAAGGRFLVWDGEVGDVEFSGILSQNQAFWLRTIDESPSLSISESAKLPINNSNTYRSTEAIEGLVLSLSQGELIDRLYYRLNNSGSLTYLPQIDAVKRFNGYFSLYHNSNDSIPIAIKNLAYDHCFSHKLGIKDAKAGSYKLEFKHLSEELSEGTFIFKDLLSDSLMRIEHGLTYEFLITITDSLNASERFILSYEPDMVEPQIEAIGNQLKANYQENIQWFRNDEPIEGETNPILSPSQNGSYYFQVNYKSCSLTSPTIQFSITANKEELQSLQIFSNPVTDDRLIISSANKIDEKVYISLINAEGKVVLGKKEVLLDKNYHEVLIPKEIQDGLYYLNIESDDEHYYLKVVVQR
jgi:pimeloyl-ACP methyl ester carboxylesterase